MPLSRERDKKIIKFTVGTLLFHKKLLPLQVFRCDMKQILIVIGVLAVAMLLLCVRILLKKNGKFSSQHISENKRMKQDGIHCATSQDRQARRKNTNKIDLKKI